MLDIKTRELRRMEKDLELFNARALPYATRQTVNQLAWTTRRAWQGEIRERLVTRNKWTEQSVRVQQTRSLEIRRQESRTGSTADYMERQEYGGTVTHDGSEGHPIATSYASGEGMASQPRRRLPRKPNKLRNIHLSKARQRVRSQKQRNLLAVKEAAQSGRPYVWLDLGRRQGIFRVTGGRRNPNVRMVWDMSRKSVRTPRTPTLEPALQTVGPKMDVLYRKALRFQLKRHKILGY